MSHDKRSSDARLTITTRPGRTVTAPLPDLPAPLFAPGPYEMALGRAASPRRREGPEKLTGLARYTDDLVFPGAWYGATIRSTEAHARL
ncbi:MAG: hypothetical protein M3492_00945, partial [Actinomycetota bacterium]|nr:hypothetical protein [Actinomycetota bacterium]